MPVCTRWGKWDAAAAAASWCAVTREPAHGLLGVWLPLIRTLILWHQHNAGDECDVPYSLVPHGVSEGGVLEITLMITHMTWYLN